MKKIENCENCPIMKKIGKDLMLVYDYTSKSNDFFGCTGNSVMNNNKDPNIFCFMRHTYNTEKVDWGKVKEFYEEHKDAFRAVGLGTGEGNE